MIAGDSDRKFGDTAAEIRQDSWRLSERRVTRRKFQAESAGHVWANEWLKVSPADIGLSGGRCRLRAAASGVISRPSHTTRCTAPWTRRIHHHFDCPARTKLAFIQISSLPDESPPLFISSSPLANFSNPTKSITTKARLVSLGTPSSAASNFSPA